MKYQNISRREFLQRSAAVFAGLASVPQFLCSRENNPVAVQSLKPGKIVIAHHTQATSGTTVSETVVQKMVDDAIMQLTGISSSPAAAFESLFPNLTTSTKIAIKPNFLANPVPTRRELAKAIVNRLTQMLGGTFPAYNIYFYERHGFGSVGYTTAYFGQNVHLVYDVSFPDLGYYIYCDGRNRPYSKTLHDCDYLINMPVLKDHSWDGDFTLAFKNHMGTVNPEGPLGIHGNVRAVLDIMASDVMRKKQVLVVLDAIFGIYTGGPSGNIQCAPNTILMSQDPVTIDYHGRAIINSYRQKNGLRPKNGNYIEMASGDPWRVGISDPSQMEIIRIEDGVVTSAQNTLNSKPEAWALYQNYPNPFNVETDIEFELQSDAFVNISIYDVQGRLVQVLVNEFKPARTHLVRWHAGNLASGIYTCKMTVGGRSVVKSMNLVK